MFFDKELFKIIGIDKEKKTFFSLHKGLAKEIENLYPDIKWEDEFDLIIVLTIKLLFTIFIVKDKMTTWQEVNDLFLKYDKFFLKTEIENKLDFNIGQLKNNNLLDVLQTFLQLNKKDIMPKTPGLIFEKLNSGADGSIYTPKEIVNYMTKETLKQVIINKFNEVYDKNFTTLEEWKEETTNNRNDYNKTFNLISILDPSTGTGHFIIGALNRMLEIKSYLGLINKTIFEEKKEILLNNINAIDINYKAILCCKMMLFVELLNGSLNNIDNLPNLDNNIICGDSLTMFLDEEV